MEYKNIECDVKKLSLSTDDVILITTPNELSPMSYKRFIEYLDAFKNEAQITNKILVLSGISSVTILQKGGL